MVYLVEKTIINQKPVKNEKEKENNWDNFITVIL